MHEEGEAQELVMVVSVPAANTVATQMPPPPPAANEDDDDDSNNNSSSNNNDGGGSGGSDGNNNNNNSNDDEEDDEVVQDEIEGDELEIVTENEGHHQVVVGAYTTTSTTGTTSMGNSDLVNYHAHLNSGGAGGGNGVGGGVVVVGGGGGGGVGGNQSDMPDTKEGIEELCPVCGDKVSGYHYGLLTCESCKGFFKRTVQNKKVYTCVAERSCHIDKTQRKRCPFCRFQKCLEVGMKLEAVRADRMRGGRNKFGPMYKRDRARKLQIMRQRQLAVQTLRQSGCMPPTSTGGSTGSTSSGGGMGNGSAGVAGSVDGGISSLYGNQTSGTFNIHIKQEIQIPQVSSLTSSPDSSPSPIAVALGQVTSLQAASSQQPALQIVGVQGAQSQMVMDTNKLWGAPNSTTTSPHSLSPKSFQFDGGSQSNHSTNTSNTNNTSNNNGSSGGGSSNSGSNSGGVSQHSSSVGGGGGSPASAGKMSPLIKDFVQAIDDREWQTSLYTLLQNQTYNQCEVDLFELMCKVLDQNLFSQVDWARNSIFFKDLKVDDQMKLLQHSWSDMLVLDHIHQRMHSNLPDEMTLHNGQKFDLLSLGLLGVPSLADHFNEITVKLQELKYDVSDYICVKFLLLLNPEVRGITNRKHVQEGYEQVQQALLEYTVTCYPQIQDKFNKMMQLLPDIHAMAARGEEHLYHKHCTGGAPTQTLLMEMLHAKRK